MSVNNSITIVDFKPEYEEAFRSLNEEWITKNFQMEETDYKSLNHPKEYILDKGGVILVVLEGEEPVGVCALIKMNGKPYDYELAKMAVKPEARGKRIGYKLGLAALVKAKTLGAKIVYLESNTKLEPAIKLYYKLGFVKVEGNATPYERCNIQMECRV